MQMRRGPDRWRPAPPSVLPWGHRLRLPELYLPSRGWGECQARTLRQLRRAQPERPERLAWLRRHWRRRENLLRTSQSL